jgi:esterase/lipase
MKTRYGKRRLVAVSSVSLLAIGLIAGLPVRTRDLGSRPRAIGDYAATVAELLKDNDRDSASIVPDGQSILLVHGRRTPVAVLLLHGFTNSPHQFDSLASMLFRDGANVYVPRLPRHAERGGTASTLAHLTAEELRAAADSAMDVVDALGDTVVVAGLSLGGTMAAWIAQYRADAARVIVISPLMAVMKVPRVLAGPITAAVMRLPAFTYHDRSNPNAPDREPGWSTRAIAQSLRLGLAVRRASVDTAPASKQVVFLLNANDHTVAPWPVFALARQWSDHGASVQMYSLSQELGLPHDVIDPRQPIRRPDVVYPAIIAFVRGARPQDASLEDLTRTISNR